MATKLDPIRFNVHNRGRNHTGQARDFDIKKLCDSINGRACQELVKTRGMVGYYGHTPRILAGMDSVEGAMIKGSYVEFEPAVVTTSIKAFANGDIEHQTEILDTDSGVKVAKMYASKVGGFSTAIKAGTYELSGIDYVISPNFNANRPYILDSIHGMDIDDLVALNYKEQIEFLEAALAQKTNYATMLEDTLDSCQSDNDRMVERLATGNDTLDSIGFQLPMRVSAKGVNQRNRDTAFFLDSVIQSPAMADKPDAKKEIKQTLAYLDGQRRY